MPMFYTPKPRQFHYTPRFYDPDKEDWEAIKKKYGYSEDTDKAAPSSEPANASSASADSAISENEVLQRLERDIRDNERKEAQKRSKLGWKDLFKKREMPQFHYQPRFANNDGNVEAEQTAAHATATTKKRISRRFDIEDNKYFEPVSGTKIIFYVLLTCLLLLWILL